MGREIKFRVWDKKLKKIKTWGMLKAQYNTLDCLNFNFFIPMQYTGLKDKNGKEIYEGDILKELTPSGFNYSVVKFGEIDISILARKPKMCTCFYHDFSNFNDSWGEVALGNNLKNIEVIGNIYGG